MIGSKGDKLSHRTRERKKQHPKPVKQSLWTVTSELEKDTQAQWVVYPLGQYYPFHMYSFFKIANLNSKDNSESEQTF